MSTDDRSSSVYVDRQTTKVVAQLLKAVPTMHHVDEIFQWLAYTFVQQPAIQVFQVWADQIDHTGEMTIQLRSMVRLDSTIPEQVVANEDVAQVAQYLADQPNVSVFRSIDSQLSGYRTRILNRYGLNYYTGYRVRQNTGQLSVRSASTYVTQAASFQAIVVLLLMKQALHPDLLSTIAFIMNQAVAIAEKQGLLLPSTVMIDELGTPVLRPISQQEAPRLEDLVPRRKDEGDFMLSSNPFTSSSAVIKDKSARRLYVAIDGQADVAALCENTGMSIKEVYTALQVLLSLQRIEMRESNGESVDINLIIK